MELLKEKSKRVDKNGQSYTDYYLAWSYNGKIYQVRVKPCFAKDYKLFATICNDTTKDK